MKLGEIKTCYETLIGLWDRPLPFSASEKLCDLLSELERQVLRYDRLHDKLVLQYGTPDTDAPGRYLFDGDNKQHYLDEMQELNSREYTHERETISGIEKLTPRELRFLREFFDFG